MHKALRGLILLCAIASPSIAHEKPTDWIGQERRKNAKGELCCGAGVDCFAILPTSVKLTPTGYQLPNGEVVPFSKAAPSSDQFFWECNWGGERKCFFAPMGSS